MYVSVTLLLLQKSCDVGRGGGDKWWEVGERSVKNGEEMGSWENREKSNPMARSYFSIM